MVVNVECNNNDSLSGTTEVRGSFSQYQALIAADIDITSKATKNFENIRQLSIILYGVSYIYTLRHRSVNGLYDDTTSVNRLSNAFKSIEF